MGQVHQLIREQGREQALRSEHPRTVVEAAAAYLGTEESEIGFLYSGWCQAALPHKKLANDAVWQIRTDHTSLLVSPGHREYARRRPSRNRCPVRLQGAADPALPPERGTKDG